ncbi:MAG: hypothetical protein HRT35_00975 [Algicola sp.]|nr:hypothetical protein [Algicola sp.]
MSNNTDKNADNNVSKNAAKLQIIHALVWAALMLAISWVTKGGENKEVIFFLIAGWMTTQGLLQKALGEDKDSTDYCSTKLK